MRKAFIVVFTLFSLKVSIAQDAVTTLHIDPDNALAGTTSQIFDSINFIPLQTTKESLFGEINQLEVTEDYFIILDFRSRSILLFDRTGSFHARIRTDGPDQYFSFFALDRDKKEILTSTNEDKHLFIYSFDGKFLRKEDKPSGTTSFYCFNTRMYLYNVSRPKDPDTKDKTQYDLAYSNGYDKIIKQLNPYNARFVNYDYNITKNVFTYSGQPGSCMFELPFEYNVYQLNDTGEIHRFDFIFPLKYSLPKDFATDGSYTGNRAKYIYGTPENLGKYEGLQNVFRIGDYILFTASYSGRFKDDKNFAYNLSNNDLISFGKVVGDSASDYLPLLSHRYLEEVNGVYNDVIFSSIPSVLLFNIKNKSSKPVQYGDVLQRYFSTANRDDNVVIIQMRLKKGL